MTFPLYPRGFLFTDRDIKLPDDIRHFRYHKTGYGNFWFSPETNSEVVEHDGLVVTLIGHAQFVGLNESEGDLAVLCQRIATLWITDGLDAVESFLYDLGGRYALFILDGESRAVYQDAHGMRSVYYSIDCSTIASHERLVAAVTGARAEIALLAKLPLSLRWRRSSFAGINALLPNHRLNITAAREERFFPSLENPYIDVSIEERLALIERLWAEQIRLLAADNELALSLTGGLDSRTSLAMCKARWDQLDTFTYTTVPEENNAWSKSIYKDEVIVSQMLEVIDVRHKFLRRPEAKDLTNAEKNILSKNSAVQHGRWLLKLYQQNFSNSRTMHLRANLHETARNYFHGYRNTQRPLDGLRKLMREQIVARQPALEPKMAQVMQEFEAEFESSKLGALPKSYEPLDMYYWEARQARWFSEVFNETDVAFDTAIPFNHRRIIDLALSFNATQRKNGYVFQELINRNASYLNFFGVNSTANLYEQSRDKMRKIATAPVGMTIDSNLIMEVTSADGAVLEKLPFDGEIYLPAIHAVKGASTSLRWKSTSSTGKNNTDIQISVDNSYDNSKAANYLRLVIEVNGKAVLSHDLAFWPHPFGITLTDLDEATMVSIRVESLRDIPRPSWEHASRTKISFVAKSSFTPGHRILTDNPVAKLLS